MVLLKLLTPSNPEGFLKESRQDFSQLLAFLNSAACAQSHTLWYGHFICSDTFTPLINPSPTHQLLEVRDADSYLRSEKEIHIY